MAIMEYFRVNGYNLVYGSLRLDPPMHQLVFIKLLALCSISRVPGTICLSAGVPYPAEVLASTIGVDPPTLQAALTHHAEPGTDRIHINDWGGIEIVNWATYQSKSYERTREYRERLKNKRKQDTKKPAVTERDKTVTTCDALVTGNKRDERKEKYTKEKKAERKEKLLGDSVSSLLERSETTSLVHRADEPKMFSIQKQDRLFSEIWKRYPRREGKKAAWGHFKATSTGTGVLTEQDWQDVNTALDNYLSFLREKNIPSARIKMGQTWFNNWRDWIVSPFSDPEPSTEKPKGTPKDFGCHR